MTAQVKLYIIAFNIILLGCCGNIQGMMNSMIFMEVYNVCDELNTGYII